jgi:hypothetical protein
MNGMRPTMPGKNSAAQQGSAGLLNAFSKSKKLFTVNHSL